MLYDLNDWYFALAKDDTQVYSSTQMKVVPIDDKAYQAWLKQGSPPSSVDSMDDVVALLRSANVPPYHKVSTYTIVLRLETANLIEAADQALTANKSLWRRFYTVAAIDADNADARNFLSGIGADPDQILAPE